MAAVWHKEKKAWRHHKPVSSHSGHLLWHLRPVLFCPVMQNEAASGFNSQEVKSDEWSDPADRWEKYSLDFRFWVRLILSAQAATRGFQKSNKFSVFTEM